MKLCEHQVPRATFTALAAGGGGAEAVELLAAGQHSKHMLLIRGVMDQARAQDHPQASGTRRAYDLLATLQHDDPEAVDPVLQHPAVGAWARRTILALRSGDPGAVPQQMAAVAAAAAIRAGTSCDIDVPAIDGRVTLPSLGQAIIRPTATATVQCDNGSAEVLDGSKVVPIPRDPWQDSSGWQGLREMSARVEDNELRVVVDDLDPYRMPGMPNVGDRLDGGELDVWRATLQSAWELLVRHHRHVAEEVAGTIRVLTPLAPPPQGQSSATSREAFGCVALSAAPDPVTMAVTLTHETQHAKLSALLDLIPLTSPDDGSRYYAPWRDDPRPIPGLFQGAYAYLGVTDFWRHQRELEHGEAATRAAAEFSRWRVSALSVARTLLASGRLTAAGEIFVTKMSERLTSWSGETVPTRARALAEHLVARHRAEWHERNG